MNTKKDYTKEYITIPDTDEKVQWPERKIHNGIEFIPATFADPPGGPTKGNSCKGKITGTENYIEENKKYPPVTTIEQLINIFNKESKLYDNFTLSWNTSESSVYLRVGSEETDYVFRNENNKRPTTKRESVCHKWYIVLRKQPLLPPVPPPTSHIEEKLLSKVERIKSTLGLDAELRIIDSITKANKLMGLPGEGRLQKQADALLDELGI
tara:strand:+ start:232 stop:864 length:633 start_codon:yes stop_codon:yes gene_type:complete